MRFLLELVPCCISLNPEHRKAPGSRTTPPKPESEDDDDVGSLATPLPPPRPPRLLRKRVRTATWSPSLSVISEDRAATWSPTLSVISEDRAAMTTPGGGLFIAQRKVTESAGSVREGKGRRTSGGGRGGGAGAARAPYRRRDRDEYEYGGSYPSETMIPAFSPTPFVF